MNSYSGTMAFFKKILGKAFRRFLPGTFEHLVKNKTYILNTYYVKERIDNLYVSMTTFEPRLKVFEYAVLSILNGAVLPEKLLIYVPKGFRELMEANSDSFLKCELGKGLIEMIEMDVDLGCHSKYFYTFQKFGTSKDIVICDDDVVYYSGWLKDLNNAAVNFPADDVFAFKAVEVKIENKEILPYDKWVHCSRNDRRRQKILYAEGVGGVLFRKNKLIKAILSSGQFLKLAPKADDVWLWFCTYLNKLQVKHIVPNYGHKLLYVIPNSQGVNLWSDNTLNKRNDVFIKNCHVYFLQEWNFDISRQQFK